MTVLLHEDDIDPVQSVSDDLKAAVLVGTRSIMVINDGPGVPSALLHKRIRPFERGTTAAEGSGLGLSVAHASFLQAGGGLELRSPLLGDNGFAAVLRFD